MGKKLALVDKTAGLTRDRREGLSDFFGDFPIRLVDTAGIEASLREETLKNRQLNRDMVKNMVQ